MSRALRLWVSIGARLVRFVLLVVGLLTIPFLLGLVTALAMKLAIGLGSLSVLAWAVLGLPFCHVFGPPPGMPSVADP